MPKVRILRGEEVLAGFVLGEKPLTLGRGTEADINVPDKRLSRRHCQLEVVSGDVVVTDLESTNGLFYAGEKVQRQKLKDQDEFAIGDVRVIVETERLKLGTTEFAVPGGGALPGESTVAERGGDETGQFAMPHLQAAGAAPVEVPKGLMACARRLDKVTAELTAVHDDFQRALGHDASYKQLLERLRKVTIEAEALVGD